MYHYFFPLLRLWIVLDSTDYNDIVLLLLSFLTLTRMSIEIRNWKQIGHVSLTFVQNYQISIRIKNLSVTVFTPATGNL